MKTTRLMGAILAATILAPMLSACSSARLLAAAFRSTNEFVALRSDPRILYEPGAEAFAQRIAPLLPTAISKVEVNQYASFINPVQVYICASDESYYRFTAQRSPATVTSKLFISPNLFVQEKPLENYLIHELSHLHLLQRIGLIKAAKLPAWFKEGLAELVSGGATGSSVTPHDAYAAINAKRRFTPDEGRSLISSFLFPRYGSYWHIENRMFYRQSMLFVEFMRSYDEGAFHKFLVAIEDRTDFKKALSDAYHAQLTTLWEKFLEKSGAMTVNQAWSRWSLSGQ